MLTQCLPEALSSLLVDYQTMVECVGIESFDDFARGYAAIDEWFAVNPIPRPYALAS
jgi:hypothetical protein